MFSLCPALSSGKNFIRGRFMVVEIQWFQIGSLVLKHRVYTLGATLACHVLLPDLQKQALNLGQESETPPCDQSNFITIQPLFQILSHLLCSWGRIFLTLAFRLRSASCMEIRPKRDIVEIQPFSRCCSLPKSVLNCLTFFLVFYSWLQFLPFSQAVDERKNEQDGWVKYSAGVEA